MAFKQFPHIQYYRSLNSDQITRIGYFNVSVGIELQQFVITLIQIGIINTPYQIRMHIYGNDLQESPIFSSQWEEVSAATLLNNDTDPPTAYTQNWTGIFPINFDGYPLNPNVNYYMSVETQGYARVGDSFYCGINLDWYSEVNNQLDGPGEAGARIRILGIR